jgi:biotin carboxyl carrier protein
VESEFCIGGESHTVSIDASGNTRIDGADPFALESTILADGTLVLVRDGRVHRAIVARGDDGEIHVAVNGANFVLESPVLVPDRPGEQQGEIEGHEVIASPMPGQVASIPVAVGDEIAVKQTVAVVVAMKMENEVRAKIAGVVTAIHAAEGEQVTGGQPLLEIEEIDP